jgi:hypothetical protein
MMGLIALGVVLFGASPEAQPIAQVAVVPVRAVQVEAATVRTIETAIQDGLGPVALSRRLMRRRLLGDDLAERADACGYEVGCLAELGRRLGADVVVVGRLEPGGDSAVDLELIGIDVDRAFVRRVMQGRLAPSDRAAGAATLARAVALSPDARIELHVEPTNARVDLFGARTNWPLRGVVDVPSGAYLVRLSAPAHEPAELRFDLQPGRTFVLNRKLELDPFASPDVPADPSPFEGVHRAGLGVDPTTAGAAPPPVTRPAWPRILLWSGVTVAVGAAITGAVLIADGQGRYDELSQEVRFSPSTTGALDAAATRQSAADQVVAGGIMVGAGLALAAGGVIFALAGGLR